MSDSDQVTAVDLEEGSKLQRETKGYWRWVIAAVGVSYILFHLITIGVKPFPDIIQRAIHLGGGLVLVFLLFKPFSRRDNWLFIALDIFFVASSMFIVIYTIGQYDRIVLGASNVNNFEKGLALLGLFLILEGARRAFGWILPALALIAVLYAYFGMYIPGEFAHPGIRLNRLAEIFLMSGQGFWGGIVGISVSIVAIFVIFGGILLLSGGAQAFFDIARFISKRSIGGEAKTAVISSSLFGTISGSAAANVATTGVMTIPMMRRAGYSREFAGAVEATASTGGQLLPPIMGAGAFLMAEFTGTPYRDIAIIAFFPAFLYYLGVFVGAHYEAKRLNMKVDHSIVLPFRQVFNVKVMLPLLLPLAVLIYYLLLGYSPGKTAFNALVTALIVYAIINWRELFTRKLTMINKVIASFESAAKTVASIALLVACAQIVVSMVGATGVGVKMSQLIVGLSGSSFLLALIFGMGVSLILGMGLPTTAAYVLAAAVVAPALINIGITPLHAHLFIFYFASLAVLTPPVCTAVYIASSLSKGRWIKTAGISMLLAIAGFIIPYMFIYEPALLLEGTPVRIAQVMATSAIGVMAFTIGGIGFYRTKLSWLQRVMLIAIAVLFIIPDTITDIIAIVLLAGFLLLQWYAKHKVAMPVANK